MASDYVRTIEGVSPTMDILKQSDLHCCRYLLGGLLSLVTCGSQTGRYITSTTHQGIRRGSNSCVVSQHFIGLSSRTCLTQDNIREEQPADHQIHTRASPNSVSIGLHHCIANIVNEEDGINLLDQTYPETSQKYCSIHRMNTHDTRD